jgi:SOS response associated peptidase (SRAP)
MPTVADIHDRMPVILASTDYTRWLGEEPDPRDLMRPYPAELKRIWPISRRVKPRLHLWMGDRRVDLAVVRPIGGSGGHDRRRWFLCQKLKWRGWLVS